jgi:hypothetical protein
MKIVTGVPFVRFSVVVPLPRSDSAIRLGGQLRQSRPAGRPTRRALTAAFPQKGWMILQRTRPPRVVEFLHSQDPEQTSESFQNERKARYDAAS